MSKVNRRKKGSRSVKAPKPDAPYSLQVTASQVLVRLFDLFEHVGIAMPEVKSLFAASIQMNQPPHPLYPHASAIGEMLTAWHQNHAYLDRSGTPAPIRFRTSVPSFVTVRSGRVDYGLLISSVSVSWLTAWSTAVSRRWISSIKVSRALRVKAASIMCSSDATAT